MVTWDWRKNYENENTIKEVRDKINLAYEITGKKVVVIAVCAGNRMLLNSINSLEEDKEKVKHYLAIAPAFLGSALGMLDVLFL